MSIAGIVADRSDRDLGAWPASYRPEFERAVELFRLSVITQRHAIHVLTVCAARRARRARQSAVAKPAVAPPALSVLRRADAQPAQTVANAPQTGTSVLTRRQQEVARLIARGCTNAQIAEALFVTEGTAANHVAAILQRLELTNRTQVAAWAVSAGVLS